VVGDNPAVRLGLGAVGRDVDVDVAEQMGGRGHLLDRRGEVRPDLGLPLQWRAPLAIVRGIKQVYAAHQLVQVALVEQPAVRVQGAADRVLDGHDREANSTGFINLTAVGIVLPMTDATAQLAGRVALITGAGSGIGAATARLLAQHGAAIAVTDIDGDSAGGIADEIRRAGGIASPYMLDVVSEDAWRDVVARVVAELGPVTILHGNAAPTGRAVMSRDLDVLSAEVDIWDLMASVVLRGNVLGCKHTVRGMVDAGGGSIVLTSSIKGRVGSGLRAAYSTMKGGLEQLVKVVATEYGRFDVRCNGVAPGIIATPGLTETVSDEAARQLLAAQLLGRVGQPEDIAAAIAFLASDDAAWITGITLPVEGGLTTGPGHLLNKIG
jgi:NAD(P)-dependent dehydrogenase (short-subunit alcohol dehydrogenase family)